MAFAEPDGDLGQIVEEEVGEVFTGDHHDRLDLGVRRAIPNLAQRTEEAVGLLAGGRLPVGGHHRCMGGRVGHHDLCHRAFPSWSFLTDSSSGR